MSLTGMCWERGVDSAQSLFSHTNTTGTVHSWARFIDSWKWPMFVCQNNDWAESTPRSQHMPVKDIADRAKSYGMHTVKVDGQDVGEVYKQTLKALEHARSGQGPVFMAVQTYRLAGHYIGDPQVYRPKGDLQKLRGSQDPIAKLRDALGVPDDEFEAMDAEVTEIVEESVRFSKEEATDPAPEDALKYVYA